MVADPFIVQHLENRNTLHFPSGNRPLRSETIFIPITVIKPILVATKMNAWIAVIRAATCAAMNANVFKFVFIYFFPSESYPSGG